MKQLNMRMGVTSAAKQSTSPARLTRYPLSKRSTPDEIAAIVAHIAHRAASVKALMAHQDEQRAMRHPQDNASPAPRQSTTSTISESA